MFKKEAAFPKKEMLSDFAKILIGQQARAEKLSEADVIDHALAETYLPANSEVKRWCVNYLLTEKQGIQLTLATVFDYVNIRVAHDKEFQNLRPLVVFAHHMEASGYYPLTGNERDLPYLCKKMRSLYGKLEDVKERSDERKKVALKSDLDFLEHLIMVFEKGPENGKLLELYSIVLEYWDDLKDWDYTYRMLWAMTDMAKWKNLVEYRMQCLELLKRLTVDWPDEAKRDPLEEYFTA